jgi:hypothetical protein
VIKINFWRFFSWKIESWAKVNMAARGGAFSDKDKIFIESLF